MHTPHQSCIHGHNVHHQGMAKHGFEMPQVDVYSFGVVLWELWTGREPYDGLNYHALLHQITTSKGLVRPPMPNSPEWEHAPLPELVPGYKELIEACWEENPSKRPT